MFKEKTSKDVRLIYGIIFGVYTLVVGALFIWQTIYLYKSGTAPSFSGPHPFTRERVFQALSKISLFFWLWVGGVVVGFVLWEVFPVKEKVRKISPDLQFARLNKRMPSSAPQGLEREYASIVATKKALFAVRCAAWALFGIACVYGVVYLCIPSNFPGQNVTGEIFSFVKHVFPCVFAGLLSVCAAGVFEKFTVKKALNDMRKITKGALAPAVSVRWYEDARFILAVRIALAVIGVALVIWGCLNGSARSVFIKAVNICTECIGLG